MKIVSWNANMAFRNKIDKVVNEYNPDIIVVQECENTDKISSQNYPYTFWVGDNQNKGLAIFSKYEIDTPNSNNSISKYHIAVKIHGVFILAIWAMNDKEKRENRYIGQVYNTINHYKDYFQGKSIILGDFNWNINFDNKPSYPLIGNFFDVIATLEKHSFYSLYHLNNNESFGKEKNPTFYMHKNRNRTYHIDYVFTNISNNCNKIQLGEYEQWYEYSDHVPLYVEIEKRKTV